MVQAMPVLGLLLLFQYTVLLGPPPFTGLRTGPGWLLLALQSCFGARQHLSEDAEARGSPKGIKLTCSCWQRLSSHPAQLNMRIDT